MAGLTGGKPYYILTQFRLGLEEAKVRRLTGAVKLRKGSVEFFENVMRATRGEITNPYRIYSYLWLRDFYTDKEKSPPDDLFWDEEPASSPNPASKIEATANWTENQSELVARIP